MWLPKLQFLLILEFNTMVLVTRGGGKSSRGRSRILSTDNDIQQLQQILNRLQNQIVDNKQPYTDEVISTTENTTELLVRKENMQVEPLLSPSYHYLKCCQKDYL